MNRYYFDIDDISAYFQRCGKLSLRNGAKSILFRGGVQIFRGNLS